MHRWIYALAFLALVGLTATEARAQSSPPTATVTIYRIAPGQHLAFLEWVAAQEAVSREAGAPASTWYVHIDGDAWDYIGITPETTPEMDAKVEALMKQKGMKTGMQAGLEFRRYVAWHTDTTAAGPISIQDILAAAKQ